MNRREKRYSILLKCLFVAVYVAFADPTAAVADQIGEQRERLDEEFRDKLEAVADKCDELEMPEQARATRQWLIERTPGRQYIFLPADSDPATPPATTSDNVQYWYGKFTQFRQAQADGLFDLAEKSLANRQPTQAYQLLHEVLRENPDHERARRILGYSFDRVRRRWRRPGAMPSSRRIRIAHPLLDRGSGGYWRVETEHFEIATDHSAEEALELGRRLESLYDVWRQVFFRHWSSEAVLAGWFDGPATVRRAGKKHKIILFRDREEYVTTLGKTIPGIEVSQGIYMDEQETSFMYAGDPTAESTWLHEATHQLFQENGRVAPKVGREESAWVIEGIAMYIESLVPHEGYCTLGGWDARRLQYARYRASNERFYVPLDELVGLGRDALQQDERRGKLYSQSAGLAHFLMDGEGGRYREATVDYLRAIYAGLETRGALAQLTGETHETLDQHYHRFLDVTDDDLLANMIPPERITALSLGHTSVSDRGLVRLQECTALVWLDLAHTKTSDAGARYWLAAVQLTQLNLEGTQITDAALETVGELRRLEILDLSGTQVTDEGLANVKELTALKELWLTNTKVSDAGLAHLQVLEQLETLEVSGTRVTQDGYDRLRRALPSLKN